MIFTGTFKTYDNINTYSVTIGDTGVTGDTGDIATISDPTEDIYGIAHSDLIVMFDPDPVIINTDRQDLTKRIIISQATINLLSNKNMTDILVVYKNGEVYINMYGDGYLYEGDWTSDVWEIESQRIKQWAYVDKYFAKEINNE